MIHSLSFLCKRKSDISGDSRLRGNDILSIKHFGISAGINPGVNDNSSLIVNCFNSFIKGNEIE